jgi:hypothetical protein
MTALMTLPQREIGASIAFPEVEDMNARIFSISTKTCSGGSLSCDKDPITAASSGSLKTTSCMR